MTQKAGSVGGGGRFVPVNYDGKPRVGGKVVRVYSGDPGGCSFCGGVLKDHGCFVDGATVIGPWANMCGRDAVKYGVGIGQGRGQRYEWMRLDSGASAWVKVQG